MNIPSIRVASLSAVLLALAVASSGQVAVLERPMPSAPALPSLTAQFPVAMAPSLVSAAPAPAMSLEAFAASPETGLFAASMPSAATGGFKTYEEAMEASRSARLLDQLDKAIPALEAATRLAENEADRQIALTILDQTKTIFAAQQAEARHDYEEAIRLYGLFIAKWPVQAGRASDRKATLERYQELLPPTAGPMPSGVEAAQRVLALLRSGASPNSQTPQGRSAILVMRRILRPLMDVQLRLIEDPAPADVARFRDFARTLLEAGQARSFGELTGTFSTNDPQPSNGQPNGLLAFALVKFADLPTQNAFGVHDQRE